MTGMLRARARLARRRPLAGTLAALACLPFLVATGSPASADSVGAAQARARALVAQVHAVQARLDRALARYNSSLSGLAGAVNSNVAASTQLTEATAAVQARADAAGARVRALYRSGGPLALYASVLEGTSPGDMLDRLAVVQQVVSSDRAALVAGHAALASAQRRAHAAFRFVVLRVPRTPADTARPFARAVRRVWVASARRTARRSASMPKGLEKHSATPARDRSRARS